MFSGLFLLVVLSFLSLSLRRKQKSEQKKLKMTHPVDSGEPGKGLRELPEAVHRVDVGGADSLVPEEEE